MTNFKKNQKKIQLTSVTKFHLRKGKNPTKMSKDSGFLLSGYLYKLKAGGNSNTLNPFAQVGSLWIKRFFVVEERVTRAGRECFFSYYLDEKSANDVRAAKEAVPLQDIMHVSPLATGRLNLYMSRISKLDARSKGELLQHKDLIVEVEVPFRIYFLQAEGRADMLKWAAGLQRLSGLRVEAPWPVHLGPLPPVPALIIEHRKVSGTLPIEMYTTPVEAVAPSFGAGPSAAKTNVSESPFAPIKHSVPMRADTISEPSANHNVSIPSKGIAEALSSSLSSSSSTHFEMPKTSQSQRIISDPVVLKNPPNASNAKALKKKELVIEGDTMNGEGKHQDHDDNKEHLTSNSLKGRLGLPLIILKPNQESTGTQSLLEGALAKATHNEYSHKISMGNKKSEIVTSQNILPQSSGLYDSNATRQTITSSVQLKEVKHLNVLDDDDDDNEVDYASMARARITTPSRSLETLPSSLLKEEEAKFSESPAIQLNTDKVAYSSPARPQTARGRGQRPEALNNIQSDFDDNTPPVSDSIQKSEESNRPSSWMRGNDAGFRDASSDQRIQPARQTVTDDWDEKEENSTQTSSSSSSSESHQAKKLSDQEKARLKIGDPGVRRDEDILSSWDD